MSKIYFILILVSVSLSAFAQILLKNGMNSTAVQASLNNNFTVTSAFNIITNGYVFAGLCVYFGSALVWLMVLSKIEVSIAYPFVALGFVITAILGHLLFGESLTPQRLAGILLVCVGVGVLARG